MAIYGTTWRITLPVTDQSDADEYKEKLTNIKNCIVYFHGQLELGDTTGLHLQAVLKYSSRRSYTTVAKLFDMRADVRLIKEHELLEYDEYCKKTHTGLDWNFTIGSYESANIRRSLKRKVAWEEVSSRKDKAYLHNFEQIVNDGSQTCLSNIRTEVDPNVQATRMRQYKAALLFSDYEIESVQLDESIKTAKSTVWNTWQQHLMRVLDGPINDRKVILILDPKGNTGKTYFKTYYSALHNTDTFTSEGGPTKDILYAAKQYSRRRVVMFDFMRTQFDHINVQAVEQLKNGSFTSTKYESKKVFGSIPHCVIFSNNIFDLSGLSFDRWEVWLIETVNSYKVFKSGSVERAFNNIQYCKRLFDVKERLICIKDVTEMFINKLNETYKLLRMRVYLAYHCLPGGCDVQLIGCFPGGCAM